MCRTLPSVLVCMALAGCASDAPQVSLTPPPGLAHYADRALSVSASVSDADHDLNELIVRWSSDLDGEIDGPVELAEDGGLTGEIRLSAGVHSLIVEVEDPRGNVTHDATGVLVHPTNRTPSCGIASPSPGQATLMGSSTRIEVTANDADIGPEALTVSLSSDLDGDLGVSAVDASGLARVEPTLSTGTHALTLTATDELGLSCEASLLHTVGKPPTVRLTTPEAGAVEDVGVEMRFAAVVGHDVEAAEDLALSWRSDVDGELSLAKADPAGNAVLSASELSRGVHTITLRATDSLDFYDEDSVDILVNGPPTAPVVSLLPGGALTADPLEVQIDTPSTDAEDDAITLRYEWRVDDILQEDLTEPTVPAERTARDQVWRVRAIPSDARLDGPFGEASLTIGNTAPELSEVSLSDTSPRTDDVLTAIVVAADEDGDAITYDYAWMVNGSAVSAAGPTLDGATHFDKGDTISVSVTPSDDGLSGTALASATATAINSAPTAPSVAMSDGLSTGEDDVSCDIDEESFDADDDSITYTFTWEADGTAYPSGFSGAAGPSTGTHTDDTVPAEDHDLADDWTCSVVASDGTETSPGASDTFYVRESFVKWGYFTEFPYTGILARNYLLGHPVVLSRDTVVTELSIIAKRTASNGRIALYTESSGRPHSLVVGSSLQAIRPGPNTFSVTPTLVKAGTYWIMSVYDSTAYVGEEQRARHTVYYQSMSATGAFPTTLTGLASYSGYRHNYYAGGYE